MVGGTASRRGWEESWWGGEREAWSLRSEKKTAATPADYVDFDAPYLPLSLPFMT
jgi:hypothetical protein